MKKINLLVLFVALLWAMAAIAQTTTHPTVNSVTAVTNGGTGLTSQGTLGNVLTATSTGWSSQAAGAAATNLSTINGTNVLPMTTSGGGTLPTYGGYVYGATAPLSYKLTGTGDSVTVGFCASASYLVALGADMGISSGSISNLGTTGFYMCDIDQNVFTAQNPSRTGNPFFTIMGGINDAAGGAPHDATYKQCLASASSWMAIPSTNKITGQNAACVQSGTWVNETNYNSTTGVKSTTNGSTLTCTIATSGYPIYAWYQMANLSGGTFTYALDGGSTTSVASAPTPSIIGGNTTGMGFIRIPNVAQGSHTVTFNVTSATNASNTVSIWGVGTGEAPVNNGPSVYVLGIPPEFNNTQAAGVASVQADALSVSTTLSGDGLPVYYVNTAAYVTLADMVNGGGGCQPLHPNDSGQTHIKDAIEGAINFQKNAWQVTNGGNAFFPGLISVGSALSATNTTGFGATITAHGGFNTIYTTNDGASFFNGIEMDNQGLGTHQNYQIMNSGLASGGLSAGVLSFFHTDTTNQNLTLSDTAAVFSGSVSANAFKVNTGGSLPANGVYLSAANTLDVTTSGAKALEISTTGNAKFLQPPATPGYTVSTLPTGIIGMKSYVTDQLTSCAIAGAALTGGGSVTCPVFYNGSAWVGD